MVAHKRMNLVVVALGKKINVAIASLVSAAYIRWLHCEIHTCERLLTLDELCALWEFRVGLS